MLSLANGQGLVGLAISVLLTSAFSCLVYILFIAIYRVTIHPLAKYPGPFLAKTTNLYSLYHAWKGDRHLESFKCHELYGDVYRCGPNSLSFNTTTALQAIYGSKSNCWKGEFYTMFPVRKNVYSVHSEIDKERHAHKRRVLSHAFSDKALKAMEEYILIQIRIFCAQIGSTPQPRNMASQANYLTSDILGDLCFGQSFAMQEKPENRSMCDIIQKAAKKILAECTMPEIRNWHINTILYHDLNKMRQDFAKYCMERALERTKALTDRKDFFHYLLNATDPETGSGFPMPELWAESSLLIVAGSDTSSTTLAAAFFYLTHNAPALEKLKAEIHSAFEDVEGIRSGSTLSGCAYLRACIDEALRLSPPVPGFLPREVLAGGATIDELYIPEGTVVGCAAYALHHNEKFFSDPFAFRPERWLVKGSEAERMSKEEMEKQQAAFCPFSLGVRGCIGRNMAYMELLTAVARTVWLYEMKVVGSLGEAKERKGEFELEDVFVSRKKGPMVEFIRRTD